MKKLLFIYYIKCYKLYKVKINDFIKILNLYFNLFFIYCIKCNGEEDWVQYEILRF